MTKSYGNPEFDPSQPRDKAGRWSTEEEMYPEETGEEAYIRGQREAQELLRDPSAPLYHGTSAAVLDSILREGIKPELDKNYGETLYNGDRKNAISVTKKMNRARIYATHAAQQKGQGKAIIFTVDVPSDVELHTDKVGSEKSDLYTHDLIKPEWIKAYDVYGYISGDYGGRHVLHMDLSERFALATRIYVPVVLIERAEGVLTDPPIALIYPHEEYYADLRTISRIFQSNEEITAMLAGTLWQSAYASSKAAMEGAAIDENITVRWTLDPESDHCAKSDLFYGCPEIAKDYPNWDALPTVPAGDVTCRGNCRCTIDLIDKRTGQIISDMSTLVGDHTPIIPTQQEERGYLIEGDLPAESKSLINDYFRVIPDALKSKIMARLMRSPIFTSSNEAAIVAKAASRGQIGFTGFGGYGGISTISGDIYLSPGYVRVMSAPISAGLMRPPYYVQIPLHEIIHMEYELMDLSTLRRIRGAYDAWGQDTYVLAHLPIVDRNANEFWAYALSNYLQNGLYMFERDPRLYDWMAGTLGARLRGLP